MRGRGKEGRREAGRAGREKEMGERRKKKRHTNCKGRSETIPISRKISRNVQKDLELRN